VDNTKFWSTNPKEEIMSAGGRKLKKNVKFDLQELVSAGEGKTDLNLERTKADLSSPRH
jgi:hypothetical protein